MVRKVFEIEAIPDATIITFSAPDAVLIFRSRFSTDGFVMRVYVCDGISSLY